MTISCDSYLWHFSSVSQSNWNTSHHQWSPVAGICSCSRPCRKERTGHREPTLFSGSSLVKTLQRNNKKVYSAPHLAEYLLLITGWCKLKMKLLCDSSLELCSAETAALKFPILSHVMTSCFFLGGFQICEYFCLYDQISSPPYSGKQPPSGLPGTYRCSHQLYSMTNEWNLTLGRIRRGLCRSGKSAWPVWNWVLSEDIRLDPQL